MEAKKAKTASAHHVAELYMQLAVSDEDPCAKMGLRFWEAPPMACLKKILLMVHPDKHGNSKAATDAFLVFRPMQDEMLLRLKTAPGPAMEVVHKFRAATHMGKLEFSVYEAICRAENRVPQYLPPTRDMLAEAQAARTMQEERRAAAAAAAAREQQLILYRRPMSTWTTEQLKQDFALLSHEDLGMICRNIKSARVPRKKAERVELLREHAELLLANRAHRAHAEQLLNARAEAEMRAAVAAVAAAAAAASAEAPPPAQEAPPAVEEAPPAHEAPAAPMLPPAPARARRPRELAECPLLRVYAANPELFDVPCAHEALTEAEEVSEFERAARDFFERPFYDDEGALVHMEAEGTPAAAEDVTMDEGVPVPMEVEEAPPAEGVTSSRGCRNG